MARVRNLLFIMADQLRWDHLSCYGHRSLRTPHLDGLASRGVRFERAYVQSPVCGPSRMSTYTGRYVASHRSFWNFVPLPLSERTLGEYLSEAGIRTAVAGKTHVEPDLAELARLGLSPDEGIGLRLSQGGFEPYDRDDGVFPEAFGARVQTSYANHLRAMGYDGANPWHDHANSARGPGGEILSGWYMRYAREPAAIPKEHSETAYMTTRAIDFIDAQGEAPWCLHLSYIKPHWPYVAPAPYHCLFEAGDVQPPVRAAAERKDPHPVYGAYQQRPESLAFSRDEVRDLVAPTYMGLVRQLDDEIGRLLAHLQRCGRMDDTLIVFTSDHGDYLGDHWLGEKELFHDASARVPLIVYDPDPAADASRGRVEHRLAEAIDLLPTMLDAVGVPQPSHRVQGRSLLPLWREAGLPAAWREFVFSELDYSFWTDTRLRLGRPLDGCRARMVCDGRWKLVTYQGYERVQLFDLDEDPGELRDLGTDPARGPVLRRLSDALQDWSLGIPAHETAPDDWVSAWWARNESAGVHIGRW
ncbi:MAG: sulfatase-like hydrolase/transferase [Burkholderiaceae bacterium]